MNVSFGPDGSMTFPPALVQQIFANQSGGGAIPQGMPPGMGGPPPMGGPPGMGMPPPGPPMGMPPPDPMMGDMGMPPALGAMPPGPPMGLDPSLMGAGMPGAGGPPIPPPRDISVPGGASVRGGSPRSAPMSEPSRFDRDTSSSSSKKPADRFNKNKKKPMPKEGR